MSCLWLLAAVLCTVAQAQDGPAWPRTRRQFPGGEWVPLTQPCPTCRLLNDPSDARTNVDDIGLVPPRPPVTRQIHGSGNFFAQNPGLLQGSFPQQRPQQYQSFLHFNQFQQQQAQPFFTPQQQQSFLPQTYLNNPQLLLNENPQLLPLVSNPQLLLSHQKQESQQAPNQNTVQPDSKNNGQIRFRPESQPSQLKPPQNIRLEQERPGAPLTRLELPSNSPPAQFINSQFQQQQFQRFPQIPEQQSLLQVNPGDPFLTPPPFRNNATDIEIPGLEKEEIQLLYVPVETLRQRGHLQGHTVDEPKPTFLNQQFQQFQQPPSGHFITQNPTPSGLTSPSPTPQLSQSLPSREPPQQFATQSPSIPHTTEQVVTIQPRPVSTVRQSEKLQTPRPSDRPRTTFPSRGSSTFSQPPETFTNEVTPSFTRNSPTPSPTPEQPRFQQHRFTPRPAVETVTEITVPTTTLQPHQPPLSVFMGPERGEIKVVDVLRALKHAETIPVLDTIIPNGPKVFVGPANLNPPPGFGKFELPYLSNLDSNRVERKIDLPFFVAPLNFVPPNGYEKIPFPAPHVGSVIVSSEREMQSATLFETGTTSEPVQQQAFSHEPVQQQAFSQEPVQQQVFNQQPETTTALPETTTRFRGRRPGQYRPPSRRPNSSSRQRVTPRPQDEETTLPVHESQVTSQDFLREPQEERKRITPPRRNRVKTTTEPVVESLSTEAPESVNPTFVPQGPVVELDPQFVDLDQPQPPPHQLQQPIHNPTNFQQQERPHQPTSYQQQERPQQQTHFQQHQETHFQQQEQPPGDDFIPPPPPPPAQNREVNFRQPEKQQFNQDFRAPQLSSFQQPPFVQPSAFDQFQPTQQEIQGLFAVPPPPSRQQEPPTVENNGDTGLHVPEDQRQGSASTTEQPISSTQVFENLFSPSTSSNEPQYETESSVSATTPTTTTTEAEQVPEKDTQVDPPRKSSRFSYPNVPGVKSHPGSTKVRSHVRSRPRGGPSHSTTAPSAPDAEHIEVSGTAEEVSSPATEVTTSKYLSHFNRSRKPLRTTTPRSETTTSTGTRSYTVRPLRRTTARTSISTKRIRKPTTPAYNEDLEEHQEQNDPKETQAKFVPSAGSNEIFDDQPTPITPKPKVRKPYFRKKTTVEDVPTSPQAPTKLQQGNFDEEPKNEESRISESDITINKVQVAESGPSAPAEVSAPSAGDALEESKVPSEERKKATDPELQKKPRRRLRVRVQKRPSDNFETAESQNHGSLANALIPATPEKPTAPDLYRFTQGNFDFDSSGKFIGTHQKGHVRNITADILESTNTFSAPGADVEVNRFTIASEVTTVYPDNTELPEKTAETDEERIESDSKNETLEVTTQKHETTKYSETEPTETVPVETTTESEEELSTFPAEVSSSSTTTSTTTPIPEKRQRKVLRTSTTTQVSHETEICYKGKCIKTNADNPEKALKQLVETANSSEAAKART